MSIQNTQNTNASCRRNRSDEFSGMTLQPKWQWLPSTLEAAYRLNGLRLQLDAPDYSRQDAQNDLSAKMLQDAPEGDWIIDTYLVTVPSGADGAYSGIIVYADAANWLAIGRQGSQVIARGVMEGADTGILACAGADKAMRIFKDTKSAAYDRYLLYSAATGTMISTDDHVFLTTFEDKAHLLKHARIGLFTAGGPADFEWFQCSQMEMKADFFFGTVLDGIWRPLDGTSCETDKGLHLAAVQQGIGGIIRPALHKDFVIYAKLARREARGQGCLLVWKDQKNYLLYGADGEASTGALFVMDGNETVLFSRTDDVPCMAYQCEKREQRYIFRSSADGLNWQDDYFWEDTENILGDAWYGLGSRRKEKAVIEAFRELAAPDGKILATNHLRNMGALFGGPEDGAINETVTPYAFRTGDLGSLVQDGNEIYMMMGDSFTGYGAGTEGWRSNVLAVLKDPEDPEKGVAIKRMILDEEKEGYAKEVIRSEHIYYKDFTTIPTGGVKVGNRIYWIYDSISQWCKAAHMDSLYTGWAYSDDGGQTFTRVDSFFTPDEEMVFCFPYKQDGYVYLFGSNGKKSGLKLARVPEDAVLDRKQYVFWAGNDAEGNPVWIENCHEAGILFDGFLTEFCIVYNAGLGRYTMAYLDQDTCCNVIRDAEKLWGPWSRGVMLAAKENIGQNCYMPSTVNRWVSKEGMYFFFTYYTEYVCKWCHIDFVTEEAK